MKAIGGYFGLELQRGRECYHPDAVALSTGRGAFALILEHVRPKKVYLPYYICNVVMTALRVRNIRWEFVGIRNDFTFELLPDVKEEEIILVVDYFGLMGQYLEELENIYGSKLVIDATQSFFRQRIGHAWMFNSVRKFFGVPDGSYLYVPPTEDPIDCTCYPRLAEYEVRHLLRRLDQDPEEGYPFYKLYEYSIDNDIRQISTLSLRLIGSIDFDSVAKARIRNYTYLEERLAQSNSLKLTIASKQNVPFMYPYMNVNGINHSTLISERIYVTKFWIELPYTEARMFANEEALAKHLIPLPVDHRYALEDMKRIISIVEAKRSDCKSTNNAEAAGK